MPRRAENKVHCCNQWVTVPGKAFQVAMTCSFHSDTAWVRTMAVYQPQKTRQLNWPLSCSMSNSGSHVATSDICSPEPLREHQNPGSFFQEESRRKRFQSRRAGSLLEEILSKLGRLFSHYNPRLLLILLLLYFSDSVHPFMQPIFIEYLPN